MSHYAHSVNEMINLIRKDAYMKSLFFLKNHLNFWLYWGIMRDEVFVLNHARLEGNGTGLHCQKKVREKWSMRLQGNLSWKSVEHMWFLHSHPWIIPKQNFFFFHLTINAHSTKTMLGSYTHVVSFEQGIWRTSAIVQNYPQVS